MAGTNQVASETWVPQTDKFGNQTRLAPGMDVARFNAAIQDLANRAIINNLSPEQARALGIPMDRNGFFYGQSPADKAAFSGYTLPNNPDVTNALANWTPNIPGVSKEQAYALLKVGPSFPAAPTVSQETINRQLAEAKANNGAPPGITGGTGSNTPGSTGGAPVSTAPLGGDFQGFSDLPAAITSSEAWQQLSNEQKTLAYFTYKAQTATNEAQRQDALNALNEAQKIADPYFKEQIRLAQDEVTRGASSIQSDTQSKITSLQDRIKQINEDLTFNKGELSFDQQAELAQQLRTNQKALFDLQQSAAESGLVFSSPRQQAEQDLLAEQQGISESTNRKYNRLNREQDVNAQRSIQAYQQQLADTQRAGQENLTSLSRRGEQQLGTGNLPTVPGVNPLGGITGSIEENRQGQVVGLQGTLQKQQNPFNFN